MCINDDTETVVIVNTSGEHAGQLKLDYHSSTNTALLHSVVIFEEYRNRGVMRNIMNTFIVPKLRDMGILRITLECRTPEIQIIWNKLGFTHAVNCIMERTI